AGHRRARPRPAGRGVGPHPGTQQAAQRAPRVLPPSILAAFAAKRDGLLRPEARAILAAAPTPAAAARFTLTQLRALLTRAGRSRGIDTEARRLQHIFRATWLHQPPLVEQAMGRQALALLGQLEAACTSADELAAATIAQF